MVTNEYIQDYFRIQIIWFIFSVDKLEEFETKIRKLNTTLEVKDSKICELEDKYISFTNIF